MLPLLLKLLPLFTPITSPTNNTSICVWLLLRPGHQTIQGRQDKTGEHETQTRLVTENDNLFTARSSTQSMDHDQNSQEQEEQAAEEEEVSHSVGQKNKNLTAALSTSESNNMSS